MEIKLIEDIAGLIAFLNDTNNTGNIVEAGQLYHIKPDAIYVGIYKDSELVGVMEARKFWHSTIEIHPIFSAHYRGEKAIDAMRLFFGWMLANFTFTNLITMVPETTRYGAVAALALGASRIGILQDAFIWYGEPVAVTLYQLPRAACEELCR
jgi:hypothetical protein